MERVILLSIRAKMIHWIRLLGEKWYSKYQSVYDRDLSFAQAVAAYPDPNKLYAYMHHYLRYICPQSVRNHRNYFKQDQCGFGEDAFHAAWWLLLLEFKPCRMLEIGVYRGQVISLWTLISQYLGYRADIHGISPFSPVGDSVSSYAKDLDYMGDIYETFNYWRLPPPVLIKSLSTDPEAVTHIQSQ
ncbi:hypothetical protein KJ656_12720, partial [bacterium]|nr:hypothetical protein [bacterium]